jgi:hypothetical protein
MNDWEYSYNGFTFGGNSIYGVTGVTGLGSVPMREDVLNLPGSHGAYVRSSFGEARRIVIEGDVWTDESLVESAMNALRSAFTPQETAIPLTYQRFGDLPKRVYAKRTKFDFPIDFDYQLGYAHWLVEFLAGDPRIYSEDLSSVTVLPGASSNIGVDFDIDFSFTFGGGASGSATLVNLGMIGTYPTVRVYGPATNPQIRNVTTGDILKFNIVLATGDFLDIDMGARTVLLGGTASRYSTLDAASTWWSIGPGSVSVQFIADGTTAATYAVFSYRSAWI